MLRLCEYEVGPKQCMPFLVEVEPWLEEQIDPGPGLAAWSDSLFTLTPAQHRQGDFLSLCLPHPPGPSFLFNGLTQDFQDSTQRLSSPELLPLWMELGTLRSLLGDKLGSFEDGRGWF